HGDAERWERYRANIAAAGAALRLQNSSMARRALDAAPQEHRNWEWQYLHNQLDGARAVAPMRFVAMQPAQAALTFFPAGKRIMAGSPDGTMRVWDTATGGLSGMLPGHGYGTLDAALDRNGRMQVLTWDGTLVSWELPRNEGKFILRVPTDGLNGQLLSPDCGLLLATKAARGSLWDLPSGRKRADLPGKVWTGGSTAVFSTDGRYLAYSTEDHAVHVWDVHAGVETRVLLGHSATVRALAFSRDGKRLALSRQFRTALVYSGR